MFLELIIVIHVGLRMCDVSIMGMTQIGAQVIVNRKNINKKYLKRTQIRMAVG